MHATEFKRDRLVVSQVLFEKLYVKTELLCYSSFAQLPNADNRLKPNNPATPPLT